MPLTLRAPLETDYGRMTKAARQANLRILLTNIKVNKVNHQGVDQGALPFEVGIHHYFYYLTGGQQPLPETVFVHFMYRTLYLAIAQFPRLPDDNSVQGIAHNCAKGLVQALYDGADGVKGMEDFSDFYGIDAYKDWQFMTEEDVRERLEAHDISYDDATAAYNIWREKHLAFRLTMDIKDADKGTARKMKEQVDMFIRSGIQVGPHTPTSEYICREYASVMERIPSDDEEDAGVLERIPSDDEEDLERIPSDDEEDLERIPSDDEEDAGVLERIPSDDEEDAGVLDDEAEQ